MGGEGTGCFLCYGLNSVDMKDLILQVGYLDLSKFSIIFLLFWYNGNKNNNRASDESCLIQLVTIVVTLEVT